MSGYYGIGEVFVKVEDLDRAAAFYRDLLGFELVPRNEDQLDESTVDEADDASRTRRRKEDGNRGSRLQAIPRIYRGLFGGR
ncbi:MAG: VOC family protein [Candidatus Poribacteria bacterium]|nr:VOC family protein [Candidatus Poribacteria bacterium]